MRYFVSYRYEVDSSYNFLMSDVNFSTSINIWSYYNVATPPSLNHVYKTEMKFLWFAVSHSLSSKFKYL